MAGKTTYGRMALLLTLLGQCGSFVPAERARLGIVDRVFLRSGAGDDIAGGQSTFMVEMTETAAILRSATSRSLAFFDEVGRGTSTYDGMALARAIVEYLARPGQGCRTIFSTHYHELAAIEGERPTVRNLQMEVRETAEQVAFTYRVIEGAADRSYGVHVARLAGLPPSVVGRAAQVLAELEARGGKATAAGGVREPAVVPLLPDLILKLADLDVDRMTPVEALACLDEVRRDAALLVQRSPSPTPTVDGTPAAATE
jgi:DNA mismatch repair protein MutS